MSKQSETPVITATHVGSDQYQFGCWHHLRGWLEYRASNHDKAMQTARQHADEQHPGTLVRINLSGEPTTSYTGPA
jgi:hypothetical protein